MSSLKRIRSRRSTAQNSRAGIGCAGFSPWFHLPGCRFGTTVLSHSHMIPLHVTRMAQHMPLMKNPYNRRLYLTRFLRLAAHVQHTVDGCDIHKPQLRNHAETIYGLSVFTLGNRILPGFLNGGAGFFHPHISRLLFVPLPKL